MNNDPTGRINRKQGGGDRPKRVSEWLGRGVATLKAALGGRQEEGDNPQNSSGQNSGDNTERQGALTIEKKETISTLGERLKMNKELYDKVAELTAQASVTLGFDIYKTPYSTTIEEQRFMLESLYNGVVSEDIDSSSVIHCRYKDPTSGEKLRFEVVLPKDNEEEFKRCFINVLMTPIPAFEEKDGDKIKNKKVIYEESMRKTADVIRKMDASRYEKTLKSFLEAELKDISSNDISAIRRSIESLNQDSGRLFDFTRNSNNPLPMTNIVPTLESRIRLEEMVFSVHEKIVDIIWEVTAREFDELKQSPHGRQVFNRLNNNQQSK